MATIYLSAGEASGDLHAAALAAELKAASPEAKLVGMGGPRMEAAGVEIIQPIDRMAVMGFGEVIGRLPYIWGVFTSLREQLAERRPDVAVLIDYPGFHMRLARALNELDIPVVIYIAPQVWAWKAKRAYEVAKLAKRVLVIFDFEVEPYARAGADVRFVGHPLLDEIALDDPGGKARAALGIDDEAPLLALLPGSRRQVLARMLPPFLETYRAIRAARDDVVAAVGTPGGAALRDDVRCARDCDLPTVDTHDLLRDAQCALYASGTVTLEGAILGCPGVVGYRMSWLTYVIGRALVKLPHVSLPNIVMGRQVMRELIQGEMRPAVAAAELLRMLVDAGERDAASRSVRGVIEKLGRRGASARAAKAILELL